ncbi:MAG TPA: hypothetical protein VNI61_08780 [Gemmatimonadales bacterium]|nr:hypothetical protein [Gemmatimonadales bacterium]
MFWLWLGLTGVATGAAYLWTRNFVRRRLRYVDAVRRPAAPVLAGVAAAAVAVPIAGLLPVVTTATGLLVGAGVGAGVATGRRNDSPTA